MLLHAARFVYRESALGLMLDETSWLPGWKAWPLLSLPAVGNPLQPVPARYLSADTSSFRQNLSSGRVVERDKDGAYEEIGGSSCLFASCESCLIQADGN